MELDKLFADLNKHFGGDLILQASSNKVPNMERVKTSSLGLNIELGGGIPIRRIIEIYGELSSGKTSLCLDIASKFTKGGKYCVWIDAEGCFDKLWAARMGVDLEHLYIVKPETGEQAIDILDATLRSGKADLIVLDSIPAVVPKVEVDESMEKQQMGVHARMMNKMVRKIQSAMNSIRDGVHNKTTVLLINQLRNKIGVMYGSPETTPGGMGIPYAASVRIKLKRGEWFTYSNEKLDKNIGHEIKFYIEKNKTAPPKTSGSFIFYTHDVADAGIQAGTIDRLDEIVRYGISYGIIEQAGAWYTLGAHRLQGVEKVKEFLKSDSKEFERLQLQVYAAAAKGVDAAPPAKKKKE